MAQKRKRCMRLLAFLTISLRSIINCPPWVTITLQWHCPQQTQWKNMHTDSLHNNSSDINWKPKSEFKLNKGKLYRFRDDFTDSMLEVVFKEVMPITQSTAQGTLLQEYYGEHPDCFKDVYAYGESITLSAKEFKKLAPTETPFVFVGYKTMYRYGLAKTDDYYSYQIHVKTKNQENFLKELTVKSLNDAVSYKTEACFLFMSDDRKSAAAKIVTIWNMFEHIDFTNNDHKYNNRTQLIKDGILRDKLKGHGGIVGFITNDDGSTPYLFPDYNSSPQGISERLSEVLIEVSLND